MFASTFQIDAAHSKIAFKVKHLAISNVYGSFTKYDANIEYDVNSKKLNALTANVDVNSVDTDNLKRDGHLKSADFFDTKQFPKIAFKLISTSDDEAIAELTIKGITKKVTFDYENNGVIKDPWGNTKLGVSLETKISRKEFGLTWNKVLETGSFVVGDKITINVDIEAKKNQLTKALAFVNYTKDK
ncbi:polyisoprenoid-binding protein [Arcobacter sp. HD9-500m-PIT-SAG03]|nr:polyisoprenoid-binding protein [Arcobacter sp. HD9-500m-PIT-SAG03]